MTKDPDPIKHLKDVDYYCKVLFLKCFSPKKLYVCSQENLSYYQRRSLKITPLTKTATSFPDNKLKSPYLK